MKEVLLFSILIMLAIACKPDPRPLLDMTLLVDSTDEVNPLSYEDVRQYLDYSNPELLWYEVVIRQRELTNLRYGQLSECHLPAGEPNTITEQQRKMVVQRFLKQTEAMVGKTPSGGGKDYSHLYYGIASELNDLSKSRALHKVALISSNLLENTSSFSVYRPADYKILVETPDSVINILARQLSLNDLSGVTVHIAYQATPADHEKFVAMSGLYETMLSRKGAIVRIGGNLIPQTLTVP